MDLLWKDIRYSIQSLRANPGFALISILTLALGIGATTAMFSLINAVMLRPLPMNDPSRVVMVWERNLTGDNNENYVSPANFFEWRKETAAFSSMGAFLDSKTSVTGQGEPEEFWAGMVSREFFQTLNARPYLGRTLTPADGNDDAPGRVVLSYSLWQRKFGGDPHVIGKTVRVDGDACQIIGVMPRDFFVPTSKAELWFAILLPVNEGPNRGRFLRVIGRLAPGVSVQQAQARMDIVAVRTRAASKYNLNYGVNVVPIYEQVVGKIRRALLIVFAAVGFLLLIACVNVANLLLSRATARSKEMAIRAALGASRKRLIGQLLTESLVLAFIAAVLGVVIAGWATMLFVRFTPESANLPRITEVAVDLRALSATTLVTLTTAILFGLAPAIEGSRVNLQTGLKSSSRGATQDRRGKFFRSALVMAEISLATVLLIGAGLMIRSFAKLQNVDPGVRAEGRLTVHVVVPPKYTKREEVVQLTHNLIERIQQVPGVTGAGVINILPFTNWPSNSTFFLEGEPHPGVGQEPYSEFRSASPDYFRSIGIPLKSGRVFTDRDTAKAPTVFVVNDTLAQRYFPGKNPIGRRLTFEWDGTISGEIVGVVGSDRSDGLRKDAPATLYRSLWQYPPGQFSIVIAASTDPLSMVTAVARAVHSVDPLIPVSNVKTLDTLVSSSIARTRFDTTMLSIFAALGLLLASIGIYGVLSYSVAQRTHEMGIRMALGADPKHVLRLVVISGVSVAIAGVLIGLIASAGATRVMAALLFEVKATDPGVFAVVAVTLSAVALLASYVPARRATRVDPLIALQPE